MRNQLQGQRTQIEATVRVFLAAVLFSTGGAAIKTTAFSGMQVASLRSGIAAVVLLAWARGEAAWSRRLPAVALVYAATLILFVASTKLTTAASAIFLQSTAPMYVALLAPVLLRERLQGRDVATLVPVAAGLAMCLAGGVAASGLAPNPTAGNALGALSGLTWGLTLIGLRSVEQKRRGSAMTAVVAGNALACALGAPALAGLPAATVAEWLGLLYLGAIQIGCAYILLTGAVAHLPALHVALLLLLEPVLNPVWTWLIRGENPGAWTLAGGVLIIGTSAARAVATARRRQESREHPRFDITPSRP